MENQVSIIINGVIYDVVDGKGCPNCDLLEHCTSQFMPCNMFAKNMFFDKVFKKSDKKFEV